MNEEFTIEHEGMALFCKRFAPDEKPDAPKRGHASRLPDTERLSNASELAAEGECRAKGAEGKEEAVQRRPPILMLHGGLVDCDFFDDAAAVLSRLFDVVTFDRRGYGRSDDPPSGEYSLEVQAEDAYAVALACFDGPFMLLTHSVGASIGLELIARHPEAVQQALCYEPPVPKCLPPGSPLSARIAKAWAKTCSGVPIGSIGDGFLFGLAPKVNERAYEPSVGERARSARNTACSAAHEGDIFTQFQPDYEALTRVPLVVGLGEMDRHEPVGAIVEAFAQRANAPLVHFPGAHNCPADLPYDFACMAAGILLAGRPLSSDLRC